MRITHGRLTLELHELARREGPALLLLHALYGSSDDWRETPAAWPGPAYGLDFAGHGKSGWVAGGAYYPENLAADVDAALQHIGGAAIAGAGLGAYLGLLVAGARPHLVSAVLLLPGAGLDGGGPLPDFDAPFPALVSAIGLSSSRSDLEPRSDQRERSIEKTPAAGPNGADPMVWLLDTYARPVEYVMPFADAAHRVLLVEDGTPRPPWWDAVRRSPSAEAAPSDLRLALRRLIV